MIFIVLMIEMLSFGSWGLVVVVIRLLGCLEGDPGIGKELVSVFAEVEVFAGRW